MTGYWNYRVIQHEKDGETWAAIHAVYYSAEDKLTGFTVEPVTIFADDAEGIRVALERMVEALEKPPLKPEDFSTAILGTHP